MCQGSFTGWRGLGKGHNPVIRSTAYATWVRGGRLRLVPPAAKGTEESGCTHTGPCAHQPRTWRSSLSLAMFLRPLLTPLYSLLPSSSFSQPASARAVQPQASTSASSAGASTSADDRGAAAAPAAASSSGGGGSSSKKKNKKKR